MAREPIPFARPSLGPEEEEAAIRVLRSGWLTTAAECQAFEAEFAQATKMNQALAVNSATSGLHLALEALGIRAGDQIAVSPYTFTASCEIMRYLGADPLFVDIAPDSFHMDPMLLELAIIRDRSQGEPRIKAIMPVHIGGLGLFEDDYLRISEKYQIPLVEDAAHAFPSRRISTVLGESKEHWLGCEGEIGVYSFYANKTITTAEGGMIVSRNPALIDRMKTMRLHGIDREVWNRFTSKSSQWRYAVVEPGYKYNLSDLQAAIGREQLKKADLFAKQRQSLAARYLDAFEKRDWLHLPPHAPRHLETDNHEHSWHLFSVRLRLEALSISRDDFLQNLSHKGIGCSVHYIPLHMMPYYQTRLGHQDLDFPQSHKTFLQVLSLPIWQGLSNADQDYVIEEFLRIGDNHQIKCQ